MNGSLKKLVALVLLAVVAATPLVLADYAQTEVWFTVASSTSFTVTLPDASSTNSNATAQPGSPQTADIWFNSSSSNNASIMPCVTGGGNCQTADMSTTPIFQYDNTGTTNIAVTIVFNATLPTGVTVGMNSSTNCVTATAHAGIMPLNATDPGLVVSNLSFIGTNTTSAFLNATFTNVLAGSYSRLVHHTSS